MKTAEIFTKKEIDEICKRLPVQQLQKQIKSLVNECYDEKGENLIDPEKFFLDILDIYLAVFKGHDMIPLYMAVMPIMTRNLPALFIENDKTRIIGFYVKFWKTVLSAGRPAQAVMDYTKFFHGDLATEINRIVCENLNVRELTDSEEQLIMFFLSDSIDKRDHLTSEPLITKNIMNNLIERANYVGGEHLYYFVENLVTIYKGFVNKQLRNSFKLFKYIQCNSHPPLKNKLSTGPTETWILKIYFNLIVQKMPKAVTFLAMTYISEFYVSRDMLFQPLKRVDDIEDLIEKWQPHLEKRKYPVASEEAKFLPISGSLPHVFTAAPLKRRMTFDNVKQQIIYRNSD
jgi:hypothetical protein